VQYEWSEPVNVNKVEVYWLSIARVPVNCRAALGAGLPRLRATTSCFGMEATSRRISAAGSWQSTGHVNATTFEPVKTSKLRIEVATQQGRPAGILEWKVLNYGRFQ